MGQNDQINSAIRGALTECFDDIRLARATELAHSRRYDEAAELLMPQGRSPSNPKELDLLARIAARRWRFADAERLWNDAGRCAPNNNTYRLAAAQAARARRNWLQARQAVFAVIVAVVLAGFILISIDFLTRLSAQPSRAKQERMTPASTSPSPP